MSHRVPQGKRSLNPLAPDSARAPVARHCQCPQVDSFEAGVPPAHGTNRPPPTIAGVIRVDRVALSGLKARGHHGVFPKEREEGQTFIVDIVLGLDTRPPPPTTT